MRIGSALLLALIGAAVLFAAEAEGQPGVRYNISPDLKAYPQDAPKAALDSVLKAAEAGRFDYLDAQLADPSFIDDRVKGLFGGNFEEQVRDTRARLDASAVKELHRFLSDGEWTLGNADASVRLKGVSDRAVFFRKIGDRWFLEHRSNPKP